MTISDYRLPPGVEAGARGGPEFRTIIQEAISGQEQRILQWVKARAKYDIAFAVLNSSDPLGNYRAILSLFYGHLGRIYPFRFRDWGDFEAVNALFATGDASTVQFQLAKIYDPSELLLNTPGPLTYYRPIFLPLSSPAPVIKINGVTQTVTTDYTIDSAGLVTFASAPANDAALTWTGEFDIPVRFDTDYLPIVMREGDLVEVDSIPIREVLGET